MTIGLIARINAKPGRGKDLERSFQRLQHVVLADEPGCQQYDLYRSREGDHSYVVVERYEDQAAIDAHAQTDAAKEVMGQFGAFIDGRPDLEFIDLVD